jgi:DNA-directed RNA polymerase specialized sigma24 family protein
VDVAEVLGIPDGTARSRLHYATRALRTAFEASRAQLNVQEVRLA